MKIALITDTHWGIRGDSSYINDLAKKFLDNVFFPTLKENNITKVIHLGDVVDRRKYINYNTANRIRTDFLTPLLQNNIETHIIIGNHDSFYRNTNMINGPRELISDKYPNIIIYENCTEITLDIPILLVPWICLPIS